MSDPNPNPNPLMKQKSWSVDSDREETWLRRKERWSRRGIRSKSLTDEDFNELKGCIELGFGFDSSGIESDKRLSDALPALGLYCAINKSFNDRVSKSRSSSSLATSSETESDFSLPSSPLTIFSPGNQMESQQPKLKDFPYAAAPIRDLMSDLISTVETRLESHLLPCTLPQDVQYYKNQNDTAHASLFIRSGAPPSPIDHILGSWMHSELPNEGALNITTFITYMKDTSDAPQFVVEFIQSSPTTLVLILDLPPRKDLVLHPDYLKTFYEDTQLEKLRLLLTGIPETLPYISPSLYIRCVWSPISALIRIDTTDTGGEARMEEIVRDIVSGATKEVLEIWLNLCTDSSKSRVLDDEEKANLKKRDQMFKDRTIETDVGSSLPKLFGDETAKKVLGVLRNI